MKNKTSGVIHINNIEMNFNNGTGYIEKDWGYSFPKAYIWCQGNGFKEANASFMVSIANIPFKFFSVQGIICVLLINGKEYKFTTYNNAKLPVILRFLLFSTISTFIFSFEKILFPI